MKSETFRLNKIFIFGTSKYSNIKILQNEVHLSKNYAIYLVIRSKFRLNFFWDAERVKWDFNRVDWKKSETLAMSSAKEYVPGIVTCQRAETLYRYRINEFLAIYLYQQFVMVKGSVFFLAHARYCSSKQRNFLLRFAAKKSRNHTYICKLGCVIHAASFSSFLSRYFCPNSVPDVVYFDAENRACAVFSTRNRDADSFDGYSDRRWDFAWWFLRDSILDSTKTQDLVWRCANRRLGRNRTMTLNVLRSSNLYISISLLSRRWRRSFTF